MDTRQYCGQRRNCLHSYQTLHEKVQQTLDCSSPSLCPSLPYVTAYVNTQDYTGIVSPEMALQRGSSFNNLYWPYNECCRK